MRRLTRYSLGLAPLLGFLVYLIVKALWAAGKVGAPLFPLVLGYALGVIFLVVLLISLQDFRFGKMITGAILVFLMLLAILLFVFADFGFFYLVLIIGVWSGTFGIYLLKEAIRPDNDVRSPGPLDLKLQRLKGISCLMLLSGALLLSTSPLYTQTTVRVAITDEQAQNFDLVVYWGDQLAMNQTLIDICKEVNATLSFNMPERFFEYNDSLGNHCADIVRLANLKGVKIEIWPLFNWDNGSYPSYSESDRIMYLYQRFHNWTEFHDIKVDFLLWDIESGGEGQAYSGWAENIPLLADIAGWVNEIRTMQNRNENWTTNLALWRTMLRTARADGYKLRATTHAIPFDLLDGDADFQKLGALPTYELKEEYQYISMMIYRGCEGGDLAPEEYLYLNAKILHAALPDQEAVCMGCINYRPYPNVTSVVNDVRLLLAAGTHSVRIFQAHSWVAGGTHPGHGFEGLRELLLETRRGGEAEFQTDPFYEYSYSLNILADVLVDFSYV